MSKLGDEYAEWETHLNHIEENIMQCKAAYGQTMMMFPQQPIPVALTSKYGLLAADDTQPLVDLAFAASKMRRVFSMIIEDGFDILSEISDERNIDSRHLFHFASCIADDEDCPYISELCVENADLFALFKDVYFEKYDKAACAVSNVNNYESIADIIFAAAKIYAVKNYLDALVDDICGEVEKRSGSIKKHDLEYLTEIYMRDTENVDEDGENDEWEPFPSIEYLIQQLYLRELNTETENGKLVSFIVEKQEEMKPYQYILEEEFDAGVFSVHQNEVSFSKRAEIVDSSITAIIEDCGNSIAQFFNVKSLKIEYVGGNKIN